MCLLQFVAWRPLLRLCLHSVQTRNKTKKTSPSIFTAALSIVMSAESVLTCDFINFTAECNVNDVTYKDGDSFYIPQNPIHYNDIGCKICSCDRGATTCPNKAKCDDFSKFPCEKLIPAPQGKCCPTCGKFI